MPLWEADGEVAAVGIARQYELLDAAIALHGGVRPVEQGEGDSVVAAFAKASDALAAALDAQRAFAEEPWLEGRQLRVRIALHTGAAQLRDEGNYFGPTIIRCARLRAIAHGGQTLVSDATRELVVDGLADSSWLCDLGSHRLKDLGRAERVWQLCHPDLVNDFPALQSLGAVANNLPVQLTTFVGRDDELVQLCDAMKRSRLVTLTGSGGCGKTRLALQAAAEVVDAYAGGVWWVELAPVSSPELVANAVATALACADRILRPAADTDQPRRANPLVMSHAATAAARRSESPWFPPGARLRASGPCRLQAAVRQVRRRSFPLQPDAESFGDLPFMSDHLALHVKLELD